MTKIALIARYAPQVAEMLAMPAFAALLDTIREECPYVGKTLTDPTSIVRNEGMFQGWNACLQALLTMHELPKRPEPRQPVGNYHDADRRENPNQP